MENFLEFSKEVLKGIVRSMSAFIFHKAFLNKEKTTHCRRIRVVLENNILTATACTAEAAKRRVDALLFYYLYPFYIKNMQKSISLLFYIIEI